MTILPVFVSYAVVLNTALALAGFRGRRAAPGTGTREKPERILIIGATGGTGRQLVSQALERGYAVTAIARTPSALAIDHPRLTVVQGDVLDAASVANAMRGQNAVLSALGHKRFFGPTRILSSGTRNILNAMKANGISRFVCATSLGIGDSVGQLGVLYSFFIIPVALPFYFWDKARQERLIAASGGEWVIVRPAILTNGKRLDRVKHGHHIGNVLLSRLISRADVAAFMLDQLQSDTYIRTAVAVRG